MRWNRVAKGEAWLAVGVVRLYRLHNWKLRGDSVWGDQESSFFLNSSYHHTPIQFYNCLPPHPVNSYDWSVRYREVQWTVLVFLSASAQTILFLFQDCQSRHLLPCWFNASWLLLFIPQGEDCATVCPPGLYGPSCMSTCSCHNHASCSPVDGSCICREGTVELACGGSSKRLLPTYIQYIHQLSYPVFCTLKHKTSCFFPPLNSSSHNLPDAPCYFLDELCKF